MACIFDRRDAAYLPAQLYHAHALSPAAGRSSRRWPGIRIRARWKSIPGYLRWTWLPPQAVPFTADGRDAAEILRSLPPAGWRLSGRRPGALPLVKEIKTNAFQTGRVSPVASGLSPCRLQKRYAYPEYDRASFRPGLEKIFIPHPVSPHLLIAP